MSNETKKSFTLKGKGRRILMSLFGVVICAISVGFFKHASLGVDPFQSLMAGLDALIPLDFGILYVIVNAILLVFSLVFDRKNIGIATFINLFLLGYITQFTMDILAVILPDPDLWVYHFAFARLRMLLNFSLMMGPAVWMKITAIRTRPWKVSWMSGLSAGMETMIKLMVV